MDCNQKENSADCNCTYEPCSRKGNCCQCLRYHIRSRELPACCFPTEVEKTYDRSFETFADLVSRKKI